MTDGNLHHDTIHTMPLGTKLLIASVSAFRLAPHPLLGNNRALHVLCFL